MSPHVGVACALLSLLIVANGAAPHGAARTGRAMLQFGGGFGGGGGGGGEQQWCSVKLAYGAARVPLKISPKVCHVHSRHA